MMIRLDAEQVTAQVQTLFQGKSPELLSNFAVFLPSNLRGNIACDSSTSSLSAISTHSLEFDQARELVREVKVRMSRFLSAFIIFVLAFLFKFIILVEQTRCPSEYYQRFLNVLRDYHSEYLSVSQLLQEV